MSPPLYHHLVRDQTVSLHNGLSHTIKCVVIGDAGVGKTCLVKAYCTDNFPADYAPTVFDEYAVSVTIGRCTYEVVVCDTAGGAAFDNIRYLSYPHVDVFLICFSVASRASFENVRTRWIPEVHRHGRDTPYVIVGTQSDLRHDKFTVARTVTDKEGTDLARESKAVRFVECSAIRRLDLCAVFEEAIAAVLGSSDEGSARPKCCIM